MSYLIDILIPTYNRAVIIEKNLKLLIQELSSKSELIDQCRIVISDNCSTDDTQVRISNIINSATEVKIVYNRNQKNIGIEKNMVMLLSLIESPYIMWIGDDDLLADGYISYCLDQAQQNPNLGCVIPGIFKEYENGDRVKIRTPEFETKSYHAGLESLLDLSFLGHQLSGLFLKSEGLHDQYLAIKEDRNLYLFIYFVSNRLLKYDSIFAPKYRTIVPVDNHKDWSYNELGLLDEIYKSYHPFETDIGKKRVAQLLLRVIKLQADFRLGIVKNKPFKLIKQYFKLIALLNYNLYFSFRLKFLLLKIYFGQFKKN